MDVGSVVGDFLFSKVSRVAGIYWNAERWQ